MNTYTIPIYLYSTHKFDRYIKVNADSLSAAIASTMVVIHLNEDEYIRSKDIRVT